MSEQKLEGLETRIAFQDQELHALSDVIIDQQKQIDMLVRRIGLLEDKIQDIHPSQLISESDEAPPPHY